MKSILLTLSCALIITVSFGQVPANYINKVRPIPMVNTPAKPGNGGAQRGISQFEVSYHDMEQIYSDDNSFDFGYFGWDMNKSFAISLNPIDSADDNTIRWAAVVFDSIYDYNNRLAYNKSSFNSMTVDTVYWLYNHQNVSGLNDTLIVSIYAVAPTPSGIGFTSTSNMEFSNTLLWADTIITDQSLTSAGGTSLFFGGIETGGVSIPQGQGFVVRLDYMGPKEDRFSLADGNRLECGNNGAASESIIPGNSVRYYVGGLFTAPTTDFSGVGGLVFPSLPANCQEFYFQNIAISAVVTVDAPVNANATASVATGCPGQIVNLESNISGGSNDYSITWSGNGNFTSPNSPTTSVTLPQGNQVQTYTVTVIDNIENTTVTSSVNVNVRGISVSLGNDTTISCSDSVLIGANTTGFLNGSTFAWSPSGNTQSIFGKGGNTYAVTVTNSAGCTATDSKDVNLNVNQTVSFTARTNYGSPSAQDTLLLSNNRVCADTLVNFENTSTDQSNWTFTWNFGNGLQSGAVDASVAYDATGTFTVTLTADDNAGCIVNSAPLTIQVVDAPFPRCVGIVGIEEALLLSSVSLYPNPNAGSFIVDLTNVKADNANIMVVDMLGKVVYNSGNISLSSNPTQNIEMGNAANGLYFVRISANGVSATTKISVSK